MGEQYKVLQKWRDIHTKELYAKDTVIELTDERANEAIENLKKYDGEFLELIEEESDIDANDENVGVLKNKTVVELKDIAKEKGLENYGDLKKDELIKLLEEGD